MRLDNSIQALQEAMNAVAWSELTHIYGSAEDIPTLIMEALSPDEDMAYNAIWRIWGSIYHQDVLDEIVPAVTPVLVELLNIEEISQSEYIFRLLAALASEFSHSVGWPEWTFRRSPEVIARGTDPEYLALARDTWAAVRKGLPIYLRFLAHPEAPVRSQAGRLIALVAGEDRASFVLNLKQAWVEEPNPLVRASQFVALGVLMRQTGDAQLLDLCNRVLQEHDSLQKGAAAIAYAYIGAAQPDEAAWRGLQTADRAGRLDYNLFAWADGGIAILAAEALLQFASSSRRRVIDHLLESLRFQMTDGPDRGLEIPYEWPLALGVSEFLVRLVFPFGPSGDELELREKLTGNQFRLLLREELTGEQLRVVREMNSLGSHPSSLSWVGFRYKGASARRFLGADSAGPLDAKVKLIYRGRPLILQL